MNQENFTRKRLSPEAEFNTEDLIEINKNSIVNLKKQASVSPRNRYRLCLHHKAEHPVNEMIIVVNEGTYFRPHRHPVGIDESYHILEGQMAVFIFDKNGIVERIIKMGDYNSNYTFLYRLCTNLWHLPVALTEQVVYHEVLTGPFKKKETVEYAAWAPDESDKESVNAYMKELLEKYQNFF